MMITMPQLGVSTTTLSEQVSSPGSVAHQEALRLQGEMFGRAMHSGSTSSAATAVHSASSNNQTEESGIEHQG